MVVKLVEANQHLQTKLASAEQQLRAQTDQIQALKEASRSWVHSCDGKAPQRMVAAPETVLSPADTHQPSQPVPCRCNDKDDEKTGPTQAPVGGSRLDGDAEPATSLDLPGRTHFCQQVRNRMAEWKRGGPRFSIALIEAGRCGESEGYSDRQAQGLASRTTAKFLAATIRDMDVLGNYTPDCFALMMPAAGLADAIRVADRQLEVLLQHISLASGKDPPFKLSVGVVQAIETDDATSVLKRAEMALEAADRRGGNRVYCHDGERIVPGATLLEVEAVGCRA